MTNKTIKIETKRPIKATSKEIIKLLQQGKSQRSIALMGYPESTITYYYRKLFKPTRFKRFVKQVRRYQVEKKQAVDK